MRPCVGRRALHKQAPTRGVWCNGGRSGRSGVFIVGTHWWRLFWTTCHIAPLWRMKTNPAVHVSESEGQQANAHVTRPMWWLFRGKPLTLKGGGEMVQSCVYLETWGSWKHVAPRWNVTPDRFLGLLLESVGRCSRRLDVCGASAVIALQLNTMFQLFHLHMRLHVTLLVSIYPSKDGIVLLHLVVDTTQTNKERKHFINCYTNY